MTTRARLVRLDLGDQPFDYEPGQAVTIAPHGDERRRPYSLAAAPEEARRTRTLELLVGTDPADSSEPHYVPAVGDRVDVEGPFGSFTFPRAPAETHVLFVAGGTGIAPLRAMLHYALTLPDRRIALLYSARTPEEFAFQDEWHALAREGRIDLRQTVTRATHPDWWGAYGRIDRAALAAVLHDRETLCFVCGPQALVQDVPVVLADLGVAPARIRIDTYA